MSQVARVIVILVSMLCVTASSYAQDVAGDLERAELQFSEKVGSETIGDEPDCNGAGITDEVQCVAEREASVGAVIESRDIFASASLVVEVVPVLKVLDDGSKIVTLKIARNDLVTAGRMTADSLAKVRADHRRIGARLRAWTYALNAAQQADLAAGDVIGIPLERLFEGTRALVLTRPAVLTLQRRGHQRALCEHRLI